MYDESKFILGPYVKFDPSIEVPFVASLSKALRAAVNLADSATRQNLQNTVMGIAQDCDRHPTLKKELLEDPRASEGYKVMRQMDIRRDDDNRIVLKSFLSWSHKYNAWHIMLELPWETAWEDGEQNV